MCRFYVQSCLDEDIWNYVITCIIQEFIDILALRKLLLLPNVN